MSQHPYIQYRLQSASTPQGSGPAHLLLTAHYQPSATIQNPKQRWYFATSGPLSTMSVQRIEEAWSGAGHEAVQRELIASTRSLPRPHLRRSLIPSNP